MKNYFLYLLMETVTLKALLHRRLECIGIYFNNLTPLNNIIQKEAGATWSKLQQCWYVPLTQKNYFKIQYALKNKAIINNSNLSKYLHNKKEGKENQTAIRLKPAAIKETTNLANSIYKNSTIQPVNSHVLLAMHERLVLMAYSPSTIRTYLNETSQLLQLLQNKLADELDSDQLKRYLVFCLEKLGIKENTLHSRMNALKFYYEQVLGREKFFWEIPRPKKPYLLPKLLNEEELRKLFNALTNKKHKAMLFTAYSAGLRVSEIVALKIADIDSKRMQIFIHRAKGKKDRYVNLSPVLLDILRSYIKEYKPAPRKYLFESERSLEAYPTRTVQQIFTNAKIKAGIKKEVGVHSLRHSFATHLLDKGTDIKYIKELLGHFSIKTTERYLHLSKKQLINIASPFDDLWKTESIDW